jgi:hypothetical protein
MIPVSADDTCPDTPGGVPSVAYERAAVEKVPAGESAAIALMIQTLRQQLTKRYIDKGALVRRDAHPKLIGLVHARFVVSPECPGELRYGVFAGRAREFEADIRFSNGFPCVRHDLIPDTRGMAIKLRAVSGEFFDEPGQDFLLATAEAFFGKNAVDFVDFPAASASTVKTIWYFLRGLRLRGLLRLGQSVTTPASPLALEYFSQTPYLLGPHCVKYSARPLVARSGAHDHWYMRPLVRHLLALAAKVFPFVLRFFPADALREALMCDLARTSVTFEFLVQRWPDLGQLPTWAIENATRTWPAPWVRVATIDVLRQENIAARDREAERMTFTPWHALKVHQPLGGINRARLVIYRTMSEFRNSRNG